MTDNDETGTWSLPRDAGGTVRQHLDDAQRRFERNIRSEQPHVAKMLERRKGQDRNGLIRDIEALECGVLVEQFGVIYLLAVLSRADPAAADRAAAWLADQWDAGDSLGEWIWEWREGLASGAGMRLPSEATSDDLFGSAEETSR